MRKSCILLCLVLILVSCEELINEPNISNETVFILAPSKAAELTKKEKINYHWEELIGASAYQLQVATPTFTNAQQIKLDTILNNHTFSIDSLDVGDYQWRIKALNSAYETVYTTNSFVVE